MRAQEEQNTHLHSYHGKDTYHYREGLLVLLVTAEEADTDEGDHSEQSDIIQPITIHQQRTVGDVKIYDNQCSNQHDGKRRRESLFLQPVSHRFVTERDHGVQEDRESEERTEIHQLLQIRASDKIIEHIAYRIEEIEIAEQAHRGHVQRGELVGLAEFEGILKTSIVIDHQRDP